MCASARVFAPVSTMCASAQVFAPVSTMCASAHVFAHVSLHACLLPCAPLCSKQ